MDEPTNILSCTKCENKDLSVECPLNDPELPIVTENEHKVGHCFCHHCKCGKHICPGAMRKIKTSSSGWFSRYKQEFRKKNCKQEKPFLPKDCPPFLRGRYSHALITMNQIDYLPSSPEKREISKPAACKSHSKFSGKTIYNQDFTTKKIQNPKLSSPQLPYRGYMIKPWESESIYKSAYKSYNPKTLTKTPQPHYKSFKSLMNPNPQSIFDTTNKKSFQPFRSSTPTMNDLGYLRNKKDLLKLETPNFHYKSAYFSEYSPNPIKSSLNRLR